MRLRKPDFLRPREVSFRALGAGSVSSLLSKALAVAFAIMICLTALTVIGFVAVMIIPLDDLNMTVRDDDGGTAIPLPRLYALFGVGAFAAYFGGFTLILRQLRAIFRTLTMGDPFHPDNIRRLRQIGWILAVVTGGAWAAQGLVARLARGALNAPGLFDLTTPVFSVLVVFVLAEVFKEGARLRRESELTI